MKLRERVVGEVLEIDGIMVICKKSDTPSCKGCYFYNSDFRCTKEEIMENIGYCNHNDRKDRTNIIFVKMEE